MTKWWQKAQPPRSLLRALLLWLIFLFSLARPPTPNYPRSWLGGTHSAREDELATPPFWDSQADCSSGWAFSLHSVSQYGFLDLADRTTQTRRPKTGVGVHSYMCGGEVWAPFPVCVSCTGSEMHRAILGLAHQFSFLYFFLLRGALTTAQQVGIQLEKRLFPAHHCGSMPGIATPGGSGSLHGYSRRSRGSYIPVLAGRVASEQRELNSWLGRARFKSLLGYKL